MRCKRQAAWPEERAATALNHVAEHCYERTPYPGSRLSGAGRTFSALETACFAWCGPEYIVAEIAVKQEAEPIRSPKTVANHGHRCGPEVRADNHHVIWLHIDVRLSPLPDSGKVKADCCLKVGSNLADKVHSLGHCRLRQPSCRSDEATEGQMSRRGQVVHAWAPDLAFDVDEALERRLDVDAIVGPDHDVL